MTTQFTLNGRAASTDADPTTPLLYVLRGELGLNAAKFGCGLGQCGACTVLADGRPVFSCQLPLSAVAGRTVTTVEGLGTAEQPGPVQAAFEAEQAAQCGYCIPGMMIRAHALLSQNPRPTEAQMRQALAPSLCRCGTHMRILRAVRRAAVTMGGGVQSPAEPVGAGHAAAERAS
jgi:aerobic-type carbon monoxide dehydrogenase small subunit (CoxS/CutS family)